MRQRMVSPSFFVDEGLVTVSPMARLLFIGLWCIADREGRLEDRPIRLKMMLFPCDECDVSELLDELVRVGVIIRYVVGSQPLVQVENFTKHQHPHHREMPSELPPCMDVKPRAFAHGTDKSREKARHGPSESESESEYIERPLSEKPARTVAYSTSFLEFYAAYPRKVAKADAAKAWKRLTDDDRKAATAGVQSFAFDKRDDGRFIPHPSTWLNQRRWEDEGIPFAASTQCRACSGRGDNGGNVCPDCLGTGRNLSPDEHAELLRRVE